MKTNYYYYIILVAIHIVVGDFYSADFTTRRGVRGLFSRRSTISTVVRRSMVVMDVVDRTLVPAYSWFGMSERNLTMSTYPVLRVYDYMRVLIAVAWWLDGVKRNAIKCWAFLLLPPAPDSDSVFAYAYLVLSLWCSLPYLILFFRFSFCSCLCTYGWFMLGATPDAGTGLVLGLGLRKDDYTGGSHGERPGRVLPAS